MAIALGVAAAAAGVGVSSSMSNSASSKANQQAQAATEKAKRDAEQKSLMELSQEKSTASARKSLLDAPTSGFGPNKNLARSFLTTL